MEVNNNHNDKIESLKKQIEEINKIIEQEKNKQKKVANLPSGAHRDDDVNAMQRIINKNNNIRLLVRLPQSGKTQIMLDEISNFVETRDNPLALVIGDNSQLLTTQTYKRGFAEKFVKIGTISSNSNGYCKWKKLKSFDNPKAHYERDNVDIINKESATLKDRIINKEINTIVVCNNKQRWKDIENLIDMFKSTHNIVIWIDEADKTVGGFDSNNSCSENKIKKLKIWSNIIESINLITATPFTPKRNWTSVSWIGNNFCDIVELVKIPEIVGINYHHLYNSYYYPQEKEPGDSVSEYARKYLEKHPSSPGDIFLIPGTTLQKSHNEIKDMCFASNFDYVITLNGIIKSIQQYDNQEHDNIVVTGKNGMILNNIVKTKEVSEWLSSWYTENNIKNKTVAITGNLCLSRGITISSNICQITHMILGSSSTIREDEQLLSRVCGYCYLFDKKPLVVCEKNIWDDVSKYQKVIIKLSEIAMSNNQNDRIVTTDKLNLIIQDIDENKRRPYMFQNLDLDMNKYDTLFGKKNGNKKEIIMEIVKENNNSLYLFITNSKCKQITMPDTTSSYKKHVIDVYYKYIENKNFVIDFTPEEKRNDCWMGIIDNKNKRLFVIVWVVNSTAI